MAATRDRLTRAGRWAERGAALAVVGFLGAYLIRHWNQVAAYPWAISWLDLLLASAAVVAAYTGFVLLWRRVLLRLGARLTVADAHRIWYLGNLGRYIPGKIAQLAGTAYLARARGVSAFDAVGASLVAQLFVLSGGLLVAALALPGAAVASIPALRPAGLAAAAGLALVVFTPLFGRLHHLARRLARQPGETVSLPFGERAGLLAGSTAAQLVFSLAFGGFVISTTPLGWGTLWPLAGICAAGYLAGYLAVFVPGGLGVREGVYALLLAFYLPPSVAVAVAILSRLWLTVCELVVVAGLLARYGVADLRAGGPSSPRAAGG